MNQDFNAFEICFFFVQPPSTENRMAMIFMPLKKHYGGRMQEPEATIEYSEEENAEEHETLPQVNITSRSNT